MRSISLIRVASLLSLAVLIGVYGLTGSTLNAQSTTADILRTVTDSAGAVVFGASVTVRNSSTGEVRSMTTSQTGDYAFTALQVGSYSVVVRAPSFKNFRVPSILVSACDRARVDAYLQLGH